MVSLFAITRRVSRSDVPEPKGMRNDRRQSDTVHTHPMKHKSFSGPVGAASTSATAYAEQMSNKMDEAFANGSNYEVQFDDLQTYFQFSFFGEPERPDYITISNEHSTKEWVITNDEGLTIWGLCRKTADWFLRLLAEEFDYNPICQ